jgi:hypothetical protein
MAPAYGEVVRSSDQGFELKMIVFVPVTPEQAHKQFLQIDKWWSSEHTYWGKAENLSLEPTAGGSFCERDGNYSVLLMTISYVSPGRESRMLGGPGPYNKWVYSAS